MLATYKWLQVYATGAPILVTIHHEEYFYTQIILFKVVRGLFHDKYYGVCVLYVCMCCTLHV